VVLLVCIESTPTPHTRMWHDASCTNPQLPSNASSPTRSSVPSCSKPSKDKPLAGWRYAPSLTASAGST